ncbi:MAG: hypothetical protein ACYC7H_12920, partial [Chloroflexota bacterium]
HPAILCTSTPSITQTSAVIAGYEGYLQMPFDLGEAIGEIERVLALALSSDVTANGGCHCGRA